MQGRKVVEMLSLSKISYSTLKGLFGNENGASRCCLITVATELFLRSGSVQGALHTLRGTCSDANHWDISCFLHAFKYIYIFEWMHMKEPELNRLKLWDIRPINSAYTRHSWVGFGRWGVFLCFLTCFGSVSVHRQLGVSVSISTVLSQINNKYWNKWQKQK